MTTLKKICGYDNDEELLEYVKSSTEKWIVFVHSEAEGERLRAKLIEAKIVPADECILISRSVIELDDEEKVEFDFIIANETTSKRVLITTCVLDNGINIKNLPSAKRTNNILNVAISSYVGHSSFRCLVDSGITRLTKSNYTLKSANSTKNGHSTYYLFIKQ